MSYVFAICGSAITAILVYHKVRQVRRWTRRTDQGVVRLLFPSIAHEAYVRDATMDYCVTQFERRAQLWRVLAAFSFAFAIGSVVVGILIFIFADQIAANNPRLQTLLETKETQAQDVKDKRGNIDEAEIAAVDLSELAKNWKQLSIPIAWSTDEDLFFYQDDLAGKIEDVRKAASALGLTLAQPVNPFLVEQAKVVDKVPNADQFLTDLRLFLAMYFKLFVGDTSKEKCEEVAELAKSKKLLIQYNEVSVHLTATANKATEAQKNAVRSVSELRSAEEALAVTEEAIKEEELGGQPKDVYNAIPLLVIRISSVILLIFLTQILLSAYKYNAALYTHYSALADALRLVPTKPQLLQIDAEPGPDLEAVRLLMDILRPREATYVLPESPISALASLASRK